MDRAWRNRLNVQKGSRCLAFGEEIVCSCQMTEPASSPPHSGHREPGWSPVTWTVSSGFCLHIFRVSEAATHGCGVSGILEEELYKPLPIQTAAEVSLYSNAPEQHHCYALITVMQCYALGHSKLAGCTSVMLPRQILPQSITLQNQY